MSVRQSIKDVTDRIAARSAGTRRDYLDRIEALDKRGPAINAIVLVNPDALAVADSLDKRYAAGGPTGPLHCIPMIVKDNFETVGMQTTGGSLALEGWKPLQDATMVRQIKRAGAIVLAKSNLAEWAFTPYETVSSILPGYTHNPYALDRVTAGSSGGTSRSANSVPFSMQVVMRSWLGQGSRVTVV